MKFTNKLLIFRAHGDTFKKEMFRIYVYMDASIIVNA